MPTEGLQQLVSVFTRRFFFNALLPTLVFASLAVAAVLVSVTSLGDVSAWWQRLDVLTRIIAALSYLASIWFLAAAVASQWRGIVRWYEGYPLKRLAAKLGVPAVGVRWHQRRREELRGAEPPELELAYALYPMADEDDEDDEDDDTEGGEADDEDHYDGDGQARHVMPTRLGNILLAGERYSDERYMIESHYFWPRLYPLLPEQFQRDYDEFVMTYEFPLVVSFEATVTWLIASVAVLATGQSPVAFAVVFVVGLVVSYVAYVLALEPAKEVAEQQRVAFDLYRDRLLEAWPTVGDIRDEREAFQEILWFVLANVPPGWEASQAAHHRRRT
jgi:hypothetical protein